jgi:hypothetical protein
VVEQLPQEKLVDVLLNEISGFNRNSGKRLR